MSLGPNLQGVLLDWKKGDGNVCTLSRSQGHGAYLSSDATSSEFQKSLMFGVVKHKTSVDLRPSQASRTQFVRAWKKNRAPIFALNVDGHCAMIYFDDSFYAQKMSNESESKSSKSSVAFRFSFHKKDLQLKNPGGVAYSNSGSATWVLMWITSLTGMPLDATDPPASQWGACSLSQPTMI